MHTLHIGKLVPLPPVGPATPNGQGAANQVPDRVGIPLVVDPTSGPSTFLALEGGPSYEWRIIQNANTILRASHPHQLPWLPRYDWTQNWKSLGHPPLLYILIHQNNLFSIPLKFKHWSVNSRDSLFLTRNLINLKETWLRNTTLLIPWPDWRVKSLASSQLKPLSLLGKEQGKHFQILTERLFHPLRPFQLPLREVNHPHLHLKSLIHLPQPFLHNRRRS